MDFNVGIILWPNNFDYLINMTEVEDYVKFEAVLNHWTWNKEEKGWRLSVKSLPLVPCSSDKFYEPYGPRKEAWNNVISLASCI